MLFQSLDKLKRQSILAAILMMALGVVMLICPESYVNTLVVTVGYGIIIFAIVEMLEFIVSKKALIHYITFTIALFIAILGVFILIYNQDLLKALGWLFGFVLVQGRPVYTVECSAVCPSLQSEGLVDADRICHCAHDIGDIDLLESLVGFPNLTHEDNRRRAPVLCFREHAQVHLGVAVQ